jgi:hypothetical protein
MYQDDGIVDGMMGCSFSLIGLVVMAVMAALKWFNKPEPVEEPPTPTLPNDMINI